MTTAKTKNANKAGERWALVTVTKHQALELAAVFPADTRYFSEGAKSISFQMSIGRGLKIRKWMEQKGWM